MFAPHYAKIKIKRREPSLLDVEKARKILDRRVERLAYATVEKKILSTEKTSDKIAKAKKKFSNQILFDDRRQALRNFIDIFNKWRAFYTGRDAWRPKSLGQLTMIETIVDMVREEDLDLDIFVACCFKAVVKWKIKVPGFNLMKANGLEWYENYYEDVLAEVDASENY